MVSYGVPEVRPRCLITENPGGSARTAAPAGLKYLIWKLLKPRREEHRNARHVVGMVLRGHGDSVFLGVSSMYRSDMRLLCSGTMDGVTVMARIDLRGADLSVARLRAALPRGGVDVEAALSTVRPIVDAVADRGAEAALEYGESLDGVRPPSVRVPSSELDAALAGLDRDVRSALEVVIERTRAVHADQRRSDVTTTLGPGATVTERWVPVERVGLYVPGGNAVYPSSVVMNVVPAQAAGVGSLVVASPPQAQSQGRFTGLPHPTILAAARLLGVDEVWAVGGAQAVALMAYGGVDTDGAELAPVDMITGPGNIYVTAAKRLVRSRVGIDAEAGPTEIAILADDTADPEHVAADLISQAEHDEMAASVLVTPSSRAGRRHRRRAGRSAGDHRAPAAGDDRARRPAVGHHPGRRHRRRDSHRQRLRRRAPGDPDRELGPGCRADPFGRSDFRGRLLAGQPR